MRVSTLASVLIFLLLSSSELFAQVPLKVNKVQNIITNETTSQKTFNPEKCGFAYVMSKAKERGFDENEFELLLEKLTKQRMLNGSKTAAIYTVPIIFHIVHRGEALGTVPNISATQIAAQITQLNNDFSNLAGSAYAVAADLGIRFCAAVVDPTGKILAEPGIERLNGVTKGWSNTNTMNSTVVTDYFEQTIKPQTIWNPTEYVNMWTANIGGSGLLGWATFPGLSTLNGLDNTETSLTAGVVIAAGTVGSVASPGPATPYQQGKTATHELGHYFGLRHIWGDATCGTDYCNDTPVQDAATSGCPASPAPNNCTPAANKMFENYMDYSNDACMNTFTADQTTRAQTVMVNSLRRLTLPASLNCQSRPGNSVQFTQSSMTTTETGSSGTCPVIKTITATITVGTQATASGTLTFTLGGTAANGADYTISPASVSYTNGDNADKTVTITIIDDKAVESTETLLLGYTISGSGIVAGPDRQMFTVSITDDDFLRTINETTSSSTLLSENFNVSASIPTGWVAQGGATNVWVVSANGGNGTTGNAAHITNNVSTKPNTYDNTVASQSFLVTPLLNATGLFDITVSFKWRCKGENSSGVDYDAGYIGYILPSAPGTVNLFSSVFNNQNGGNPSAATYTGTLPSFMNNQQFKLVFYWENDDNTGTSPGFTVDDIVITAKATTVESTASTSVIVPQYSGQSVQYISSDNEIIASVSNVNQNVGCVTANVQTAGNGRSVINTATGSFFRTNKVVTLVPSSPNTTATYQGTIYFTTGELSPAWNVSEIQNMKILKVRDGVSLSSTISPADAVVVTPTFSDNSASGGYYSYTGNFTGFSQFMGVSPTFALPVDLISFEAKAEKRSILLEWKTGSELNNKGFVIERSINATTFEKIGWTDGKGTTSSETSYQFIDNLVQPDQVYYYRLRQMDIDGKEKLSMIRQAKIPGTGYELVVSPNPANNAIQVFVKGVTETVDIAIINSIGQQAGYWRHVGIGTPQTLSVRHLPKGYYRVIIYLGEGTLTSNLVIN